MVPWVKVGQIKAIDNAAVEKMKQAKMHSSRLKPRGRRRAIAEVTLEVYRREMLYAISSGVLADAWGLDATGLCERVCW